MNYEPFQNLTYSQQNFLLFQLSHYYSLSFFFGTPFLIMPFLFSIRDLRFRQLVMLLTLLNFYCRFHVYSLDSSMN